MFLRPFGSKRPSAERRPLLASPNLGEEKPLPVDPIVEVDVLIAVWGDADGSVLVLLAK